MLQLVEEPGQVQLVNWSPVTNVLCGDEARLTRRFTIACLSLDARQRLERIAGSTRVQIPDGTYCTQHWVVEMLRDAVEHGIFTNSQCREATHSAWEQ